MHPSPPDDAEPVSRDQSPFGGGGVVPAAGEAAGAVHEPAVADVSPLAALLTRHLIPDGELVVMMLKPSLFFIPITSMMVLGVAAVIALAGTLFDAQLPGTASAYLNGATLLGAVRLMWATLQWMGRYYILTDLRVMAVSGVFQTAVQQCQLRRVARVRVLRSIKERLLLLGSVEVIPQEEDMPIVLWQTVGNPGGLKERLQQAVARAKSGSR
jgi:hypothetical protein